MRKKSSFIRVEDYINIYDVNRVWYPIQGYNGYEISNDNIVRSMKHYKKYPFGMLIQPKKDRDGNIINPQDPIFVLSNNNNERVDIRLSQIIYIAYHPTDHHITDYPKSTNDINIASRNQRCFINKKNIKQPDKSTYMPKFTIVNDKIECPIESINEGDNVVWRRKL